MPTGSTSIEIDASAREVFELIHDYSRRLDWDPFLREAVLLHGATSADHAVTCRCSARRLAGGSSMEARYVAFKPASVAAVKMTRGPFFLKTFAASIRHCSSGDSASRVTYKYNFRCSPSWLAGLIEPIVQLVFQYETERRLKGLKKYLESRHR